ncbi:putative signal transduction protein [Xylona heveae TC161]|uniref:Putative signal transduction protein n=1 Tax=Xylona heveae (strain CBS 132557 / TC161) TaxID=1328760 RepID=A0A165J6B2_XYLHT|nr:putative signal transduction protein [Xylona heveae TC161]KZF25792.1 putative signal transduction protein [Xylona heveae TC161]
MMTSNSNILYIPFRRATPVTFSNAIKQYISTKYDQHPDMFAQDLDVIDRLRNDAIHSLEPHVSGVRKLMAYAAQLVWVSGKFPIDIGVDFTWYPALGYNTQRPVSQNNLRFELANVLFNLAALYSQLAISANRSTPDGLKSACNYFSLSAGVLSHIKTNVIPDLRSTPPEDMDIMTLESLEHLALAQAQECFWQKAVKDGLKDASIAKLAAKVSDFYNQAADFGTRSDTISTEWLHHMTAKHHHFAAAAQYRAACDCLEKRKYGEEVARLKDSLTCVNEALKESRWVNKVVLEDLNGLKSRVQEDLKRAEKDNDIIYLIPVPPKSELKTLDRASMVAPKVPKEVSDPLSSLGDHGQFGQQLFARLVPFAAHVAASIYVERRDRLVNHNIIGDLEIMTGKIHDTLQSHNLPGSLQALERPLGLPPGLVAHAEEVRQQNGFARLQRSVQDTTTLKENDKGVFAEGVELLKIEAAEDEKARLKHGTARWTREPSKIAAAKLYAQIDEIDGYLKSANSSDELVKNKLREWEDILRLLSGTDHDLEEFVPSSRRAKLTPKVERDAANLRAVLDDLSRVESRRRRLVEKLKEKAKLDDINSTILAETSRLEREFPMQKIEPGQFEKIFDERLTRYDADRASLTEEQEVQDQLLAQLEEANSALLAARKGDPSTKEREQALQKLENGYFKYKEIISNLDIGRKFYNDLAKIVNRFRDECKNFVYQRRIEAGQLESDLTTAMASLSVSQTPSAASMLQEQKRQEAERLSLASSNSPRPSTDPMDLDQQHPPLTAPVPTRAPVAPPPVNAGIWSPDMGIRFGGGPPAHPSPGGGALSTSFAPHQQPPGIDNSTKPLPKPGTWDPSRGWQFS